MQSLSSLEQNLLQLLSDYTALQEKYVALHQENERQREEMMRSHADLVKLRVDYQHLETAHALLCDTMDEEQRARAKQRITNLIAQIDRALAALKT